MSQVPQGSAVTGSGAASTLGVPPGFFSSLFDMNFTKFITSSVLRFLYWLIVILETLFAVGGILSSFFTGSVPYIIGSIIFFPISWLISIIFARVLIEIIMILFRMHDDLAAIRMQGGMSAGGAAAGPARGGQVGYQGYSQQGYQPPPDYPTQQA